MATLNTYLNFNGNTMEVFNFYKSVFGGEFDAVMRFSEMPAEYPVKDEEKNLIMHISLPVGTGSVLMGSDVPGSYPPVTEGTNFGISINAESKVDADRLFNALSDGGKATMPMADAFWGSYFGMLTDKFGIQWMISFDTAPQK